MVGSGPRSGFYKISSRSATIAQCTIDSSICSFTCPYLAENCKKLVLIEGSIELSTSKRALVPSGPPLYMLRNCLIYRAYTLIKSNQSEDCIYVFKLTILVFFIFILICLIINKTLKQFPTYTRHI